MNSFIRSIAYCAVILSFMLGNIAEARLLTQEEVSALSERSDDKIPNSCSPAAIQLAAKLGRENNLNALPVLIKINSNYLLTSFEENYRALSSPELESLLIDALKKELSKPPSHRNLAHPLISLARGYHSKELFNLLYEMTRLNHADSSLSAAESHLVSTDLPNIEEPIAALIPLMPKPAQAPYLVQFLGKKRYSPATGRLIAHLNEMPPDWAQLRQYDIIALYQIGTKESIKGITDLIASLEAQPQSHLRDHELEQTVYVLGSSHEFPQSDMDTIEASLNKTSLEPDINANLKKYFAEYALKSKMKEQYAKTIAPITRSLTQQDCEATTTKETLAADGPRLGAMTEEQILEAKAKGTTFFKENQEACYGLSHKHFEVLDACVKYPIDFNKSCVSSSPLSLAVWQLNEHAVSLLIAHGANAKNPNVKNYPRLGNVVWTLTNVCTNKDPLPKECEQILQILIKHGADINDSQNSYSPLMHAAQARDETMMATLLSYGADINRKLEGGGTLLDVAYLNKDAQQIKFLEDHGAKRDPIFAVKSKILIPAYILDFYIHCGIGKCDFH